MKVFFKLVLSVALTSQIYANPILPEKSYQMGYSHAEFLQYSKEQTEKIKEQYKANIVQTNDANLLKTFQEYQKIICKADNDNCSIKWNIIFLKGTQEEAFANYDGTIFIEENFKNSMTQNEMFFVLGHEMGHVALRHANEEFSIINTMTFRGIAKNPEDIQNNLDFDYGLSLRYADFIEDQELEADKFGVYIMYLDGKNTIGAKKFINSLKENNSLSVHSDSQKRKVQMNNLIQQLN